MTRSKYLPGTESVLPADRVHQIGSNHIQRTYCRIRSKQRTIGLISSADIQDPQILPRNLLNPLVINRARLRSTR